MLLLRGKFVAGWCALGWHINTRWGESAHLERVEMMGGSQEILCLLLAAQLDCWKIVTGKSESLYRLLALPSQNLYMLCGPPYASVMPDSPPQTTSPSKVPRRQCNPLSHIEIYCSCKTLRPSILRSYAGRCPPAAIISTSLSTTIGRS
jgi:hypothetical protein